ncbi:MAG TPA: hypothetical protein VGS41_03210 [Chthonomonadales bacterium]|nr:hypothetical protein [Chthonomonadales bacterium]
MKLAKRTYAIPTKTLARFESAVGSGRRSAVIASLIERYVENQRRDALRREIAEGCLDMWDVYEETAREWAPLDREAEAFLGSAGLTARLGGADNS